MQNEAITSGLISTIVGVAVTYGISFAIPTNDLQWALIAVGFASFFSGLFSHYYSTQ